MLSDAASDEIPIFMPRLLGQRPDLAALVAETITIWSYAEHSLGKAVAAMSRDASITAMREYADNWQFAKRKKIVIKAANAKLPDPYLTTFLKVLDIISGLAKRRHAFAHGIWGTVESIPDGLLLVDPKHMFMHWGAANDWVAKFARGSGQLALRKPLDNKLIEVWSVADLRNEIASMNKAYEYAGALEAIASEDLFDATNARRAHIHGLLLKDPLLGP
jgi:hypothetical protein